MTTTLSVSALSKAYVLVPYELRDGDTVVDPLAAAVGVGVAFVPVGASPADGDWSAADWEYANDQWHARCLVGPGGTVELAVGTYDLWVRATGAVEVPVEMAHGRVRIF